ncbi:hypothetical protein BDW75DRAFT_243646 [Aspergillus navahoensis]
MALGTRLTRYTSHHDRFERLNIDISTQLLVICQSIAQPAVTQELDNPSKHIAGVALASQVGLLVGAAVWGFSAGVINRKLAFNSRAPSSAPHLCCAGGMTIYISFSAMVAIYSAGEGGN